MTRPAAARLAGAQLATSPGRMGRITREESKGATQDGSAATGASPAPIHRPRLYKFRSHPTG